MEQQPIRILVLNGPNLQLLGRREPEVYGHETLDDVQARIGRLAVELGVTVECRQSNHEGELVDWIGAAAGGFEGAVLNPGAYTHTSIAIHDAIVACGLPVVEVHISNIHSRESFRAQSLTASACVGQLCGFGTAGYELALRAVVEHIATGSAQGIPQ